MPAMNLTLDPAALLQLMRTWHRNAVSPRVLAAMGERELKDIGLSPGMAAFEAAKPFCKA
jgi:uncharacterized protein YjiS (DUF1127 family)